ncbi:hypothetical protein KO361_05410 [Candidatus Woesearchaeota archaeon]|nr:hypothetical protein [Candidatus Woesearchaeota archaeon]
MKDSKNKKDSKSHLSKLKKTRKEFRKEFNKQLLTAISAAFAFLIALSWREPISEALNLLLEPLGERKTILIKFLGAVIITLIAALVLYFLSKKLKKEEDTKK